METKTFRGIKAAASLKPASATSCCVTHSTFPRHQSRGLIEATSLAAHLAHGGLAFRGIKAAASLKLSYT